MKKKGFTLIELLAVIVVLAIIALIAVPIILNIIEESRKGAAIASARSYIKATETYIVTSELDKDKIELEKNNKYNVTTTTNVEYKIYQSINDLVEINGNKPNGSEDYVILGDSYSVIEAKLTINGYEILIRNDEVISIVKGKAIEVGSIHLDKTNENIEVGKKLQLTATIIPDNASNKTVTWTSSDASIATVDNNGLVTGIKVGSVTITAKSSNGKTAIANVMVYKEKLLSEVASIGDYVEYKANGYSKWQVMYKENNTVYIVSEKCPETLKLSGMDGYNNGITYLNNVANKYLNTAYADSSKPIGNVFNYETDMDIIKASELINIGEAYWVSKHFTQQDGPYNGGYYNTAYYMNLINDSGVISEAGLYIVRPSINGPTQGFEQTYSVRVVVQLKNNIKTTIKNEKGEWSLVKP